MPRKLDPLPGYTYMGRNGQSSGPRMLVGTLITLGLALLAVVLRLAVRWAMLHAVGWEDYLIVISLVLAIARSTMLGLMVTRWQFGQHIWDIERANFAYNYEWAKAATIIYLAAMALAKVSVLLLYLRLFKVNRVFRWFCYAMIGFVTSYCLAIILANVFQCRPIKAGWSFFLPGKCVSLQKLTVATGALNIVTDVILVVMPMIVVSKLQLPRVKMIGLLIVLATGFFVVAVTIVRQVEVVRAPSLYDATYPDGTRVLWLSVELHIGIVCICLPPLSPLMKHVASAKYFKERYGSLVSLLRTRQSGDSRRSTSNVAGVKFEQKDSSSVHKPESSTETVELAFNRKA